MIEARELTKRYGDTTAVHSLSFTIAPGTVTGFLGPNGAGKSTTMRMIMGLDRPTSGTVTVNGKPYRQHRAPLREVGALLEASAVHPGCSARSHLRSMAATHNIKASRVSEVIEMTGLAGVAAGTRGRELRPGRGRGLPRSAVTTPTVRKASTCPSLRRAMTRAPAPVLPMSVPATAIAATCSSA
jgi:ABC-type multidrug transport system ATPase subunit